MHVQTRQTPLLSTHALQGRTLLVVKLSAHHVQLESSAPTMSKFLLAAHCPVAIYYWHCYVSMSSIAILTINAFIS